MDRVSGRSLGINAGSGLSDDTSPVTSWKQTLLSITGWGWSLSNKSVPISKILASMLGNTLRLKVQQVPCTLAFRHVMKALWTIHGLNIFVYLHLFRMYWKGFFFYSHIVDVFHACMPLEFIEIFYVCHVRSMAHKTIDQMLGSY